MHYQYNALSVLIAATVIKQVIQKQSMCSYTLCT